MFEHTEQLLAELADEEHGADDDDDEEAGPSVDNIEDDFIQSSDEEDDVMDQWLNIFHLFYSNCHPWTKAGMYFLFALFFACWDSEPSGHLSHWSGHWSRWGFIYFVRFYKCYKVLTVSE